MPYQVHEATYSIAPQIIWQKESSPPLYRHRELEELHTNYIERHREMKNAGLFSIKSKRRLIRIIRFYISPPLLIALVAMPLLIWQRWQLLALLNCTGLVVFTMYSQGGWPHYPAPMTGLLYAVLAQGLRLCGLLRIGKNHIGKYLVSIIVLACIAGAAIRIASDVRATQGGFPTQRSEIIQTLVARDGRHLVIVRYGSNHSVHQEWVYNRADIDGSKIAWARDMGCKLNQELIEYFHDRHIWLLQVEDKASTPQLQSFETYVDQCTKKRTESAMATRNQTVRLY